MCDFIMIITNPKWLLVLTLLTFGAVILFRMARPSPYDPAAFVVGVLLGLLYAYHVSLPSLIEKQIISYWYLMGIVILSVLIPAFTRSIDEAVAEGFRTLALSFYFASFGWSAGEVLLIEMERSRREAD